MPAKPTKRPVLLKRVRPAVRNHRRGERALQCRRFASLYLEMRENGIAEGVAGQRAAIKLGYTAASAEKAAARLLNDPLVMGILSLAASRHLARAEVKSETILRYWWDIATCEIPLPPAGACRHCWGQDHQYQYTLAEYRSAMRKHTSEQLKKQPHARVPFDDLGGYGFDKTRKPHPECTECNGQGRNYMMVIDRDSLSPAQRIAINEVRVHKDGSVSLKMRDRSRAMENLQQLMGMIQPRKPLEVLDPTRPIEENVDILLQTAIDQGLINMPQLPPVIDHDDGSTEQLAEADAA